MTNESFLDGVGRELLRLRRLADGALDQVSDEGFFWSPGPESNSAAILVKHLSGNMLYRWTDFLSSDGEQDRDRDLEFAIAPEDTRQELERQWDQGWTSMLSVIDSLNDEDLDRHVRIRRESHTVLQAIQRQLVHYAGHVGQLIYVCKLSVGSDWTTLSIPRGQSAAYNERGGTYLSN